MTRLKRPRALVIGIDGYANEAWRLAGAVGDALAFADWATRAGGVAAADLRLLLAPAPGAPPPVLPAGAPAPGAPTSQGIIDALASLRRLTPEEGGDRVYVYYAGHGAALPQWNAEPILIPVDFSDPETHSQLLLGFSRIIPFLTRAPFGEQLFFFDACRDFGLPGYEPPLQSPVGPYRPVQSDVTQYVLYSVAPGQRAAEIGKGIWTSTLLAGLTGKSYQAMSPRVGRYEVRLSLLARWLRREVSATIKKTFLRDARKFVQTPEYVPDPQGDDPVLGAFAPKDVPRARISVFIEPALAHKTCKISVREFSYGAGGEPREVKVAPPPPINSPLDFELFPADYSIQARADDFAEASQPWTVEDDPLIELTLEKAPAAAVPRTEPPIIEPAEVDRSTMVERRGSFRSFGLDDLEIGMREAPDTSRRRGRTRGVRVEPPTPGPGSLTVRCEDPFLRIKLLDAKRKEVKERLEIDKPLPLAPGLYRLRAWMPGDRPTESLVEVLPGRPTEVSLSVPAPRLSDDQIHWLQSRGMEAERDARKWTYLQPSELLGRIAGLRLGSLLSYAAYAANWTGDYFVKLRSLGAPPFPERGEQACGALVLVGVAGDRDAGESEEFLRGCRVDLLRDGRSVGEGGFTPLSGLPAAASWQTGVERPGPLWAELRLPGFCVTRYALITLPGRLSVIVAVLESDGTVDVQELLLPLDQGAPWHDFLAKPENVRKLDLSLRAFQAHEKDPLPEKDLEDLLAGRWLDPLLACVAGYSLVRSGEPERFVGQVRRGALDGLGPEAPPRAWRLGKSALVNLLSLFPGLPDAWVLAGLCDPVGEEDWFEKAVRCGVPLFAEGLRALGSRPELAEPLASLLPGSPWTAWTFPRRPLSEG